MFIFLHFLINFKHDLHVDAESMIVRTLEMSIISANIIDFTARKFFRRKDLSIFIDHMINCSLFLHSENWVAPVVGFCCCSVFCCALLCVYSGFAIILMGREELVALVIVSPCVSWLLWCSSSRCHGFVCSL